MAKQWMPRAEAAFSGRAVLGLQVAAIVALGVGFAVVVAPAPFSDWLYYWQAAGRVDRYERGGVGLFLMGLLKPLGLPPHLTILVPNLVAALSILAMARINDPSRGRWYAHVVALFLVLLTPYFGVFQLDLMATALLAGGLVLLVSIQRGEARRWRPLSGVALIAAAVSIRPQFFLVLLALAVLLPIAGCALRRMRHGNVLRDLALLLAASAVLGFALDSGLRALGDRSGAVRTTSAVTLYAGLLASDTTGPGCGQWSEHATDTMRADLDRPLHRAVVSRLRAEPPSHWLAVVRCKLPQIVVPPAFAMWWLVESPNVQARLDASPDRARLDQAYATARWIESRAYRLLTLLVYGICTWVAVRRVASSPTALLPALWLVSFFGVHLVFEVQGRYFLAMLVVAPLLAALAAGGSNAADGHRR